jgi:hypothetical protein
MQNVSIKLPVEIITEKIPHRTNSIFYAGKNIARIKVRDREYVLTTAGQYKFWYTDKAGKRRDGDENSAILKRCKDHKIHYLDKNGNISDWGWFGINLWVNDRCQDIPTDCYSTYDEAMESFVGFVRKDLINS